MDVIVLALTRGVDAARACGVLRTRTDAALMCLDASVQQLLAAPLQEGLARLEQSGMTDNEDRRAVLLEEARSKFTDVAARSAVPRSARVRALVLLALTWSQLGERQLAARTCESAVAEARLIFGESPPTLQEIGRQYGVFKTAKWFVSGALASPSDDAFERDPSDVPVIKAALQLAAELQDLSKALNIHEHKWHWLTQLPDEAAFQDADPVYIRL